MGFPKLFTSSKGLIFNCKREDREGVTLIKCEPMRKTDEIKEKLTEGPVIFRVGSTGFDLIDDGGIDRPTIKELDGYLKYFR